MLRPLLHQPDIPREGHPRTAVRYFKDIRYYLFYMLQYVKWKHWYMYLKYNIENRSLPVYKNFIMSFQNQTDFFSKYPRYNIVQCLIMKFFFYCRKRPEASEAIKRLERNPACQGLPMISFLLLPMQRITRLPLLVDAICHRLEPDTPKHKSACKALDALNKVWHLLTCNSFM